jgi:lysozyme family protein
MRANYEQCLRITLKWEGGDVDHPADPGGKTRWGITQGRYNEHRDQKHLSRQSVFKMTGDEMREIYRTYWTAVRADTLADGVDLATWDYGVNSGPSRARDTLMKSLGGTSVETIKKLCAKRLSFVRGLKTWKVFGKGWSRRIADIEARSVKMALSAQTLPRSSQNSQLTAEADKADEDAKLKSRVGKTSATSGTAGGAVVAATPPDQLVSVALLGVMGLAIAAGLYFIWRSRHDKERAKAYRAVAAEG